MPLATDIKVERYPTFVFHFTAPGRNAFLVEFEDYSGELIDTNIATDDLHTTCRTSWMERTEY